MIHKTCFECGQSLPLSCFYKHSRMRDGHLNKCKRCKLQDAKDYRARNAEEIKAYDRRRSSLPHRRSARKRSDFDNRDCNRKWRQNNREKVSAHSHVARALSQGIIIRPKQCERCGEQCTPEAHHEDYKKPLKINWLCPKCHGLRHREINAARRLTGET